MSTSNHFKFNNTYLYKYDGARQGYAMLPSCYLIRGMLNMIFIHLHFLPAEVSCVRPHTCEHTTNKNTIQTSKTKQKLDECPNTLITYSGFSVFLFIFAFKELLFC